jgi:hypothetical protein
MEHSDVRHRLSEYIDGSISAEEKTAVDEHLKTCQQCSDALHELQKTIELVRAIEDTEPPGWMTQKIMANVRAEAGKKKGIFERFFLPFSVKRPIQAVVIVFLAVTAFYLYKNMQPASMPSEAPVGEEFASRKEAAKDKLTRSKDHALRAKQVPQAPEYKALDMKQEYEKPETPKPVDKAGAPALAPAKAAEQPVLAKKESAAGKVAAAPQAGAPAMTREQNTVSNESGDNTISKRKSTTTAKGTTTPANRFEQVVQERYPDGKPKLVVTFVLLDSNRVKRAEERFNRDGERDGLQKEYYESGQVKTEARYYYGKLEWYREFQPDGVKKIGKSDFDWFWLKK